MRPRSLILIPIVALLAATTAASAHAGGAPLYYVSLGDSLAAGVQPDSSGQSVLTNDGYADQIYAVAKQQMPTLRLVKLGCPGETTTSMMDGGICPYQRGSQLAQAVAFIRAHHRFIAFVTIDIGANDVGGCAPGGNIDVACLQAGFASTGTNVPAIMAALRAAGGPDMRIVGMNMYDPFLADWLSGPAGQFLADASIPLAVQFNELLATSFGVPIANVQDAFQTTDTTLVPFPPFGDVPNDVAQICELTWMCAPPPVGPNVHANTAGYGVIAGQFEALLGL